jgi:hypothetical protein
MATTTVPTTISPDALNLAREYGVERELYEILDKGREVVRGLRAFEVELEPWAEEGDVCIIVRAVIDAAFEDDASHYDWKIWPIDTFGVGAGLRFLLPVTPYGRGNGG